MADDNRYRQGLDDPGQGGGAPGPGRKRKRGTMGWLWFLGIVIVGIIAWLAYLGTGTHKTATTAVPTSTNGQSGNATTPKLASVRELAANPGAYIGQEVVVPRAVVRRVNNNELLVGPMSDGDAASNHAGTTGALRLLRVVPANSSSQRAITEGSEVEITGVVAEGNGGNGGYSSGTAGNGNGNTAGSGNGATNNSGAGGAGANGNNAEAYVRASAIITIPAQAASAGGRGSAAR